MTEFERYVQMYSMDLTRFCLKLCRDPFDAEDLFQETWTKAFRRFGRFQPDRDFRKWLFSICANTYKNAKSRKELTARADLSSQEKQDHLLEQIADKEHDTDELLDLKEALDTLSKNHRLVIVLYYFKAFTVKEISEILSVPEGTVKSRLNTAKNLLRRRLSDDTDQ